MHEKSQLILAVIALGYVGGPLAVEFGKAREVIGFDISESRVSELQSGFDKTLEVSAADLKKSEGLIVTSSADKLKKVNCFIVTVPTPINEYKQPDLTPLKNAGKLIGEFLKKGDIVIFESTVYPGATEEEIVPVLEKYSGLKFNKEFFCGYSPERINPGDKKHTLTNIKKVTSGSTSEIASVVDELYKEIIAAGTYKVESIKIAEAAKIIENTQRDINIALMNELSLIFNMLGIDTEAVLKAAETKWNFLPFRPGLVGGHCIGVDPYYLTHKAKEIGYNPEIILSGRRLNDNMGNYVASQFIKLMMKKKIAVERAKVLIMGLSFKENCPDLRNTRVIDIIRELMEFNCIVEVYDPWVDPQNAKNHYEVALIDKPSVNNYDGIIITVAHDQFKQMGVETIRSFGKDLHVLYDLKYVLRSKDSDLRL